MSPQALDYREPKKRHWPPTLLRLVGGIVLLAGLIAPLTVPVRQDNVWMDAVTGSITKETIWFHRFRTRRVTRSAIEIRLNKLGVHCTPNLQFCSGNEGALLRDNGVRYCGRVPPIYHFSSGLSDFVDASTDQQLLNFVKVMQQGTDAQQEALVDAEFQRVFCHP